MSRLDERPEGHRAKSPPVHDALASSARAVSPVESTATCLILSENHLRRDMLQQAARSGGWETEACTSLEEANGVIGRRVATGAPMQMAWVDLDTSSGRNASYRELCETLAAMRGVLLAICGHLGDGQEEIWARQIGCWLYVPGISMAHEVEIAALCEHARASTHSVSPSRRGAT